MYMEKKNLLGLLNMNYVIIIFIKIKWGITTKIVTLNN